MSWNGNLSILMGIQILFYNYRYILKEVKGKNIKYQMLVFQNLSSSILWRKILGPPPVWVSLLF